MTKTISKTKRRLIAITMCLVTMIGAMPFMQQEAYAADGTVTYSKAETINYGTHRTDRMYIDGERNNYAYCTEPSKYAPDDGQHSYTLFAKDSIYRKVLYYLPGGYGYETVTNPRYFQGWSDTDAYVVGHLIVSYIKDGYSMKGDAFLGATQKYIDKTKQVLEIIDEDLPAPPDSFKAFLIHVDGKQDIVGSWYVKPMGWIEINKSGVNTEITDGNANYSLAGAKYGVYKDGSLVTTLTTDSKGYAKSGALLEGSYTVKEIDASKGYAIDTVGHSVSVKADKTTPIKLTEVPQNNPMEIVLSKIDKETKKSEQQGSATLKDAEFTVKYYKTISDTDPAKGGAKADRTWVFKTDKAGKVYFTKEYLASGDKFYYQNDGKTPCLPLGTVTVQETKAPVGYLLNDTVFTQKITETGTVETVKVYAAKTVEDQVKRGDLEFVKVSDGDLNRLANVPFKITSKTTGESHVIVTDKNGYASTASKWNKHTANTNEGKTSEDGIWFGTSAADDSKGALIYDDYTLEELSCDSNKGMNLLKFDVSVYKDSVTIPLGTLTNYKIDIGTIAKDSETGTHLSKPDDKVTIIDTVKYEGLKKGNEYKVVGTLMDQSTGKELLVDGKKVAAETKFTARSTDGEVQVEFTFNGVSLKGKTTVVFEDLYQEDIRLATHSDIEDEGQTIYFPEIGTTATDGKDGDKLVDANNKVIIVDKVEYSNLIAGKEYKVTGVLMDKATGRELRVYGKTITAETTFKAEKESGTADVKFTFDGSTLSGKDVVVFEKLYAKANLRSEIASHEDIKDEGQTVTFEEKEVPPADTPKTGDNSNLKIWITLLALAAAASTIAAVQIKRKEDSELNSVEKEFKEEDE